MLLTLRQDKNSPSFSLAEYSLFKVYNVQTSALLKATSVGLSWSSAKTPIAPELYIRPILDTSNILLIDVEGHEPARAKATAACPCLYAPI